LQLPIARAGRVELTQDDCVIDEREFYLKGLLEIPVHDVDERVVWGIWISVSPESYARFAALFADATREAGQHFLGWVCGEVPGYASTHGLKAKLHVREYPMRPWVELEPTSHPLALDQRQGLAPHRAIAIAQGLLHPPVR
jgi:hypothetical protein